MVARVYIDFFNLKLPILECEAGYNGFEIWEPTQTSAC